MVCRTRHMRILNKVKDKRYFETEENVYTYVYETFCVIESEIERWKIERIFISRKSTCRIFRVNFV